MPLFFHVALLNFKIRPDKLGLSDVSYPAAAHNDHSPNILGGLRFFFLPFLSVSS